MDKTIEYILKNYDKCIWKEQLEKAIKGEGTTFIGRTPQDLPCYGCVVGDKDCVYYKGLGEILYKGD